MPTESKKRRKRMKKITALAIAGVLTASFASAEMADVKVGGEIRIRDQWQNNYTDFSSDSPDKTSMITQRTRINIDAKVDERVKAYVSLENNRVWGSSGPAFSNTTNGNNDPATDKVTGSETDLVGIYQAYVVIDKLFDQPLMFKAGRQKVALGAQRLAGANDWGPGQTFDAWILGYNIDTVSANLFSMTGVENGAINDGMLDGLYVTLKSVPMNTVDVYAIKKSNINDPDQDFMTYGARIAGNVSNIDWDAELALQNGDSADGVDKSASAFWVVAGYSLPEVSGLRIGAEYDQLSGDDGTDATKDEAFDHLFLTKHSISKQHSVYGVTDAIEGYVTGGIGGVMPGLKALSINASAKPVEGLSLLAEYWSFDSNVGSDDIAIGTEMNLQVWYDITKAASLHAYYAQFTPSSDLAADGDAATDMVLQLEVKF